ncbi:MAG: hypothetical protein IIA44_02275, partial [Acidobacteria bacterium]|nr:hypothetical protein [Acidobacteriota bacterium]
MGRRTIVLVIALLLAVVSGFAIWRYLSSVESDIRADIAEVRVYRTTETIAAGTPGSEAKGLIEEGFALRESVVFEDSTVLCLGPSPANEGGNPNEVDCVENPRDLNATLDGNVAAGPITAKQVITTDQWVSPAEIADISLSESLEQGKVALAFRPDEVSAVGGFIRPGDRINLIRMGRTPRSCLDEPSDTVFFVRKDLQTMVLSEEHAQINAALAEALQQLERISEGRKQIFLVSDFQRTNWSAVD